jgi:hypothetical protein
VTGSTSPAENGENKDGTPATATATAGGGGVASAASVEETLPPPRATLTTTTHPGWTPRADVKGQSGSFLEGGRDRLRTLIAGQMPYFANRPYIADKDALEQMLVSAAPLPPLRFPAPNRMPACCDGEGEREIE